MMQPAKHRHRNDPTRIRAEPPWRWNRNALTDPSVQTTGIEIAGPEFSKNVPQVPLSENDQVIEALLSDAPQISLYHRIHQWRPYRRPNNADASSLRHSVKVSPELVIPIADDELRSLTEWSGIPELLGGPFRSWRTGNTNVHNALRIDIDYEERKDGPKPDIVGLQEITGPNSMVL